MQRQFCYTHSVRYDECNCDGVLTPPAFVRYMQDIAARDAEDAQLSGNGYWSAGQQFSSLQQITRAGRTMVRARSRWLCSAK